MEYPKEATELWNKYVPQNGQAQYVRGELIRAVEKLRDEATRNGNINFDNGHIILIEYLKKFLINKQIFSKEVINKIRNILGQIEKSEYDPITDHELYDYLVDRVVEWSEEDKDLQKHIYNKDLYR